MDEKKVTEQDASLGLPTDGKPEQEKVGLQAIVRDGIQVHPQPTSDPLDPLNWSFLRKHTILGTVALKYFLFTYITTTT